MIKPVCYNPLPHNKGYLKPLQTGFQVAFSHSTPNLVLHNQQIVKQLHNQYRERGQ